MAANPPCRLPPWWATDRPASATNPQVTDPNVLKGCVGPWARASVHTESTRWLVLAEWVTFIEASIPVSIGQ